MTLRWVMAKNSTRTHSCCPLLLLTPIASSHRSLLSLPLIAPSYRSLLSLNLIAPSYRSL
jgi:hypothetical protein